MPIDTTRRRFLQTIGAGAAAFQLGSSALADDQLIQGFEESSPDPNASRDWKAISDRKIRVGLVGYGVCKFAAAFGFQDHQNVDVVAVSDLVPDRCAGLAKATRCAKTYPSLEELVKDDTIEAVFVAPTRPATPGIASRCSNAANTWPRPCRPALGVWKKPTSSLRQ